MAAHLGVASATARRSSCRTMGGRTATRGAGTSSPTSCRGIARTGAPARRGTSEMELGIVDLKPFLPSLEGRARRRRDLGADDQRPGVVFVERAGADDGPRRTRAHGGGGGAGGAQERRQPLTSDGTGSGKTTLLNALVSLLPTEGRILCMWARSSCASAAPTACLRGARPRRPRRDRSATGAPRPAPPPRPHRRGRGARRARGRPAADPQPPATAVRSPPCTPTTPRRRSYASRPAP